MKFTRYFILFSLIPYGRCETRKPEKYVTFYLGDIEVDAQVFARKLIRLFGGITKEDVENEAKAIITLCEKRESSNIVEVMRHGWLPDNISYYYIDMEYCPKTLQEWINDIELPFINLTCTFSWSQLKNVLNIMKDIASGLAFIHRQNVVHRDLKPSNGM